MATDVMTLREYADILDHLAGEWDGEEPAVLIGDVTGSVSVSADDGFTTYGPVGFAQECFDGNGVYELGQETDRRFFGAMLIEAEKLADDAQDELGGEA